jgi:hypothetical protein
MSFNFNNAALADSASFATSLHADFFPGGKTPVKNTSASMGRPMNGQTLSARTLSDVINGDAFFRSPKYAVAAMSKGVSSSLNTLITGSASVRSAGTLEDPKVTVNNPEDQGDTADGSKLNGGAAINRIIANSLAGKNFSGSFVSNSIANLQQMSVGNYSGDGTGTGASTSSGNTPPSTEVQGVGLRNVALFSGMSEEEKGWYQERIALLHSKYPNSFRDTSFKFDIPNEFAAAGVTVYNGEDTFFPDAIVDISKRIISQDVIMQTPTDANAFVCPTLIELIIFLHNKGIVINGGFDAGRQWTMTLNDKNELWMSDHSSGRAVDISSVGKINSDPINLSGGVSKDVYDGALTILLDALAEVPMYLLPDLMCIHQDYAIGYGVDQNGNDDASTCTFKISRPWLEYVNFFADNRDNNHTNHIHLSFSGMRAGKYTGPGGAMTPAGIVDSAPPLDGEAPAGSIYIPGIGTFPDTRITAPSSELTKNYYGDWGSNIGQDLVYEMLHTTICSKEVAAIIAAITVRESGGGNPTSCNPNTLTGDFMSLGIFQINMGAGGFREAADGTIKRNPGSGSSHGKKIYELTEGTTKEQLFGWQLASKNWSTVFPGEQTPTVDNYNEKVNEKYKLYRAEAESLGKSGNDRYNYVVEKLRELVDHRVWIPLNQAYMLYTMRTGLTPYYNFSKLGATAETGYQFREWGDGYKTPYGWLGSVSFDDAVRVYQNGGGTRATLKQWVKDVYAKDASVQNPDIANSSAKYINEWLNGAIFVND